MLTKIEKAEIVKKHGNTKENTGSYEVQISLLTADIEKLNNHFKTNPNDSFSHRGFIAKVNKRKTLLKKLSEIDQSRYQALITELNIRK